MIKRLFSTTNLLLEDFHFKPGLNIILGKYSKNTKSTGTNGIGKSTLIRLIDYSFLSDSAQKIFNQKNYNFLREEKHNIIIEFEFSNKSHFIKRDFNPVSKIYYGETLDNLQDYSKAELKSVFIDLFFPIENKDVFIKGNIFRTIFDFFIKDDLDGNKRFDPLDFLKYNPNTKELAIYNFFLLDLPTKNLINYYEQFNKFKNINSAIKTAENTIETNTGKSITDYKNERHKIEDRVQLLENSLEKYDFIDKYKDVENQLVDLTNLINSKLKDYSSLENKLNKLKQSYKLDKIIEINEITKIYNEVKDNFGSNISKKLNEVIEFKNQILQNRKKYLTDKELQLQNSIDEILKEISLFEKKRSDLYKSLDEKKALDSIKNTYEELIVLKSDMDKNIQLIKQIEEYQFELSKLDVIISNEKNLIITFLREFEDKIKELSLYFSDIINNAIFVGENVNDAYFDINTKISNNRTKLPFEILINIPKADSLGQKRLKIVAYDLMVFLNNIKNNRKLPDFLIHDGVFHGVSMNTKVNTINYVYRKFIEYADNKQFQYFLTFNDDEIIFTDNKIIEYGKFEFNFMECIVAELQDKDDKTIFKRFF